MRLLMNAKMKCLIDKEVFYSKEEIDGICSNIVSKTINVSECLLYDNDGDLKEKKLNWDYMIQQSGCLMGCEIWMNEIVIDCCICSKEAVEYFLKELIDKFLVKFPNKRMGFALSYNSKWVLRWHTYRAEEGYLIEGNIEEFDGPLIYITT